MPTLKPSDTIKNTGTGRIANIRVLAALGDAWVKRPGLSLAAFMQEIGYTEELEPFSDEDLVARLNLISKEG